MPPAHRCVAGLDAHLACSRHSAPDVEPGGTSRATVVATVVGLRSCRGRVSADSVEGRRGRRRAAAGVHGRCAGAGTASSAGRGADQARRVGFGWIGEGSWRVLRSTTGGRNTSPPSQTPPQATCCTLDESRHMVHSRDAGPRPPLRPSEGGRTQRRGRCFAETDLMISSKPGDVAIGTGARPTSASISAPISGRSRSAGSASRTERTTFPAPRSRPLGSAARLRCRKHSVTRFRQASENNEPTDGSSTRTR